MYKVYTVCNTSPTSPWLPKSCHCVSHPDTLFPGLSIFHPGWFRITPLQKASSSHPSFFLPANLLSNSAPSFQSHQAAVTARSRFNLREMVCTPNWIRSSAWGIFFIVIQNFCTVAAPREAATKNSTGECDEPLVQSLLVGGLRAHGGWIVLPAHTSTAAQGSASGRPRLLLGSEVTPLG